ncbi:dicarboxylate/amino acid:cation symporter [Candidatus Korobacter versatilis]|uniref:dicarboxylate/amino acid:cation symporter n=1 Tax=Candidatus Korobacter versatilis TaxID=658062 RepID=UPI00031F4D30|nr:cation:dicarboxylase symporter family transporter [Candidatus Koribacter versatilis]
MKQKTLYIALGLFTLAAALTVADRFVHFPAAVLMTARWLLVAALLVHGWFKRSLTTWIFVAMIVGAVAGHDFPQIADDRHVNVRVLALIFLRLIKTVIAPLIFATLVVGIAGHSDMKAVGRMGIKAIVFFEVVTTLALVIGLFAINVSKAGVGAQIPVTTSASDLAAQKLTATDTILHVFPENIAKSIAEGQVLQVVVFSVLFGIGLAGVREERRKTMLTFCESLAEVMFKFTNIVMLFAPIGVGAAIAYTVGHTGLGVLVNLAKLIAALYVALIVFLVGVMLPVLWWMKVPIRAFLKAIAEPATIAFGTASSEAALPSAMECMEAFGVPRKVVAFVMPTGYSFNLTGSTLYLSLAAIFVAQASGIHMSIGQQLLLMLTLMLTSKGVAGVSRAAMVILLATVGTFGLPIEPVFVLLGIDQLMDMGRTAVNVIGNCVATVVVAKWEGEMPVAIQASGMRDAVRD